MNRRELRILAEEMNLDLRAILVTDFDVDESTLQRLEESARELATCFAQVSIISVMGIQLSFARAGLPPTAILTHTASAVENICLHQFSVDIAKGLEMAKWQSSKAGE